MHKDEIQRHLTNRFAAIANHQLIAQSFNHLQVTIGASRGLGRTNTIRGPVEYEWRNLRIDLQCTISSSALINKNCAVTVHEDVCSKSMAASRLSGALL